MNELIIKKRNLPHWILDDSIYYVTFKCKDTSLNIIEQHIIRDHIIDGNGQFYDLFAFIIMPNHIHLLLKPFIDYPLSGIMKGIKGVSANKINKYRNAKRTIMAG
jgi:REP element-mobilizing transposase RayT